LTLQAVPTAEFAPCINSLKLGWDEVDFAAESGLASIEIGRELDSFLTITLTESCDVGDAVAVPSDVPEISRFEDIARVSTEIGVTIIPIGERPLIHVRSLVLDLADTRVDDRPVVFTIDEDIDFSVRARVNNALFNDDYVWLVSDVDIEEDTLELRRTSEGEGLRGLSIEAALDLMEDITPEVSYTGHWYLVFAGGCITYDFDAEGTVAETLPGDVEEAIGLYPNAELYEAARRAGYELLEE
jgi:hypothetical protein